jgi:hypothetical protein
MIASLIIRHTCIELIVYYAQVRVQCCPRCGPGKHRSFNATDLFRATCEDCPAGRFNSDDSTEVLGCRACLEGHHQPLTGQHDCLKTVAPTATPTAAPTASPTGAPTDVPTEAPTDTPTDSKSCGDGQKYDNDSCASCEGGRYQDARSHKISSCKPCPTGQYQGFGIFHHCQKCPGGQYQVRTGQTTCDVKLRRLVGQTGGRRADVLAQRRVLASETRRVMVGRFECNFNFDTQTKWEDDEIICRMQQVTGKRMPIAIFSGNQNQSQIASFSFLPKPCQPGFGLDPSDDQCVECKLGYYSDTKAVSGCKGCPIGQHQSSNGKTSCTQCEAGRFQPSPSAIECRNCSIGSATDTLDRLGASQCVPCTPGTFSANPTVACSLCESGKYSGTSEPICKDCRSGSVVRNGSSTVVDTGGVRCDACEAGRHSSSSTAECADCTPGNWSGPQSVACDDCSPGSVTNRLALPRATSCKPCQAGHYSPNSTTACALCHGGSVTDALAARGSTMCTRCSAGQYSAVSTIACQDCAAGFFVASSGSDSKEACAACAPGHFVSMPGSAACKRCDAGSIVRNGSGAVVSKGGVKCGACSPGRYSSDSAVACALCNIGEYQDDSGSTRCKQCDEYCTNDGRTFLKCGREPGEAHPGFCVECG